MHLQDPTLTLITRGKKFLSLLFVRGLEHCLQIVAFLYALPTLICQLSKSFSQNGLALLRLSFFTQKMFDVQPFSLSVIKLGFGNRATVYPFFSVFNLGPSLIEGALLRLSMGDTQINKRGRQINWLIITPRSEAKGSTEVG